MEAINPRLEWRIFGASFREADRRFRALEPGRAQESKEVYLLSPRTDANVTRYIINGGSAEMTGVVADGKPIHTVAELEDSARVLAALREISLDQFENINYPRGLKRLLGLST